MKSHEKTELKYINSSFLMFFLIGISLMPLFVTIYKIDSERHIIEQSMVIFQSIMRCSLVFILVMCFFVFREAGLFHITPKKKWIAFYISLVGLVNIIGLIIPEFNYSNTIRTLLLISANPLVTVLLVSLILKNPVRYGRFLGTALGILSFVVFR